MNSAKVRVILESLGILKQERSVHENFESTITFKDGRYEVNLPWKEQHQILPDNFDMSRRRLMSLLQRLQRNPEVLKEYDAVIKDQLNRGIVEIVDEKDVGEMGKVHYMPHHAVIRRDKQTTKLRILYDASAKSSGPSLNDCLYIGPAMTQSVMDIILRFRSHIIALAGDIEKAFLMVSIAKSRPKRPEVLMVRRRMKWTPDGYHSQIHPGRVWGVVQSGFAQCHHTTPHRTVPL